MLKTTRYEKEIRMGYYEATDIICGPQVIEEKRVQEDGDTFVVTSTPENSSDGLCPYIKEDAVDGVNIHHVDSPHAMNNVRPFIIDGILSYRRNLC